MLTIITVQVHFSIIDNWNCIRAPNFNDRKNQGKNIKQSIIKFTSHTTVIWTGKLGKVDGISFFQYLPKNKQNIFVYFSYFNCCPFIRIWWLQLYATVCPVSRGCRQLSLKGGHWPEKRIHSIHSNQEWTSRQDVRSGTFLYKEQI